MSRSLDDRLDDLPRSVEPPRDLWPAVQAAITPAEPPRPRVGGMGMALLAAAAAALVALWPAAPAPEPPWATQMRRASASLEAAVRSRDDLDPTVLAEIERNLAVIDAAIAECEDALSDHADDPRIAAALGRAWQARLHVLTDAREMHATH